MYYIIYKITNNTNNKVYIGKHQTKNINDDYMGSGKHLKRAIKKYGIENFTKEILHVFDSEHDMNVKESCLVSKEFCNRKDTYNICPGGKGGFGYININGLNTKNNMTIKKLDACKRNIKLIQYLQKNDLEYIKKTKTNISLGVKRAHKEGKLKCNFVGKSHSEETKQKMSKKASERTGIKNSQYGTMWITNGVENKKIKKLDSIPEGWYKGRKL